MVSPTFGMGVEASPLHMVTDFFHSGGPVTLLKPIQHRWDIAQWILLIAILVLLIIDNTEWKSPLLVGLLVPLVFINAPDLVFNFIRGAPGQWIAAIIVLGILYTPPIYVPPPTSLWSAIILLIVVAPGWVVGFRYSLWGVIISLLVALVLATQHVRDAHTNDPAGPQATFTQQKRLPTTIPLILTIVIPIYFFISVLGWL